MRESNLHERKVVRVPVCSRMSLRSSGLRLLTDRKGNVRDQNEQVPLRSRPSLNTSASPKVGTTLPSITV